MDTTTTTTTSCSSTRVIDPFPRVSNVSQIQHTLALHTLPDWFTGCQRPPQQPSEALPAHVRRPAGQVQGDPLPKGVRCRGPRRP